MRILDELDNELNTNELDFSKGYLKEEKIFIKHHDAISAVEEQGHYEIIKEYPNGGKDAEWVIDVPKVEAEEAYDEYEDIQRFIKFTQKELNSFKIEELKQKLNETDYCVLKIAEGSATYDDYSEIIAKRREWRKEINNLEESTNI